MSETKFKTFKTLGSSISKAQLSIGKVVLSLGGLVLLIVTAAPIVTVVLVSFRSGSPAVPGEWVLDNWQRLVAEPDRLITTLKIAVGTAIIAFPLGVLIAWLVTRTNMPGRRVIGSLMSLPLLVSSLLMLIAYITLLAPRSGLVNQILNRAFGIHFDIYSMTGIILVLVLNFVPFVYFLSISALEAVDVRYEDAMRISGGGVLATLRFVTLPLARPALFSAGLVVLIFGAEVFTVPVLLGTTARVYTVQHDIYQAMSFFPQNPGFAAAGGTTLMIIAAIGLWARRKIVGDPRRYVSLSGKAGVRSRVSLGGVRWLAFALVVTYLVLAVFLPYITLVLGSFMRFVTPNLSWDLFTIDNYANVFRGNLGRSLANSLIAGTVSASISVGIAIVIAHIVARGKSRVASMLQGIATLPLSIPSLALGLGILWVYIILPLPLYGTLAILVIAYCTRYQGSALLIMSSRLSQIDPELHEAVRISGGSEWRSFSLVTVPLSSGATRVAWMLLFIQAVMEVSMTILLYSSETATASIQIWIQEANANSAQAHALSVILATLALVVLFLQSRLGRSDIPTEAGIAGT